MTDHNADWWTLEAMKRFGGSFVHLLGELGRHADNTNLAKIKATWPEYWDKYEPLGFELKKKDAAN